MTEQTTRYDELSGSPHLQYSLYNPTLRFLQVQNLNINRIFPLQNRISNARQGLPADLSSDNYSSASATIRIRHGHGGSFFRVLRARGLGQ
jgi:hypothetical protein